MSRRRIMKRKKRATRAQKIAQGHPAKATKPTQPRKIPYSFESPESSNIASASYCEEEEILTITFKQREGEESIRRYHYTGVPRTLWDGFFLATSKGHYFAQVIRPTYAGVRA